VSALVKADILKKIGERRLVVSPIVSSDQIGASSIDLRLGNVFLMVRARGLSAVDPSQFAHADDGSADHEFQQARRQKHERYEAPFGQKFLLHPGMLALVPTLEWIKLPNDLQGTVTARSSWAREGLSIATASLIHPGYKGIVTLELANLGQIPLSLYPGLRIAQIAFHTLTGPARTEDMGSRFDMAFEPVEGNVASKDAAFLPRKDKSAF
jgi:dCTP deaminase